MNHTGIPGRRREDAPADRCDERCPGPRLGLWGMGYLVLAITAGAVAVVVASPAKPGFRDASSANDDLRHRIDGLLVGSLIGDAAGAPTEFAVPERSSWTATDARLTDDGIAWLAGQFRLRPSSREAEPYGPWTPRGPAGTLTDDSRFKVLFFRSLKRSNDLDRAEFAREILAWHDDEAGVHGTLPREWLAEFAFTARWELGVRDPALARPPERAWGGMPTMAGQMPFLPIAALFPGDPERAYLETWQINFLDNGTGRDLNAGLIAGLAAALENDADWGSIESAMRRTDPFAFSEVPWVPRSLDQWLDRSHDIVRRADGSARALFSLLEAELGAVTWWEAHVPMTVVFSCAELARYDPLATMQLILEFGHDTDSYLQVAGALFGALHGKDVFPAAMREAVIAQLGSEYGARLDEWTDLALQFAREGH